jgi:uracil-DNA glycosylase
MKRSGAQQADLFPVHRIAGKSIEALFPESGAVHTILFGEAPGPRGADQSGIPFWGDGAGIPLYRALLRAGCARIPERAWEIWDGAQLREAGLRPALYGVALSNAFSSCPSDDGLRFRAPKRAEWASDENQIRLAAELGRAAGRGAHRIVTLGRCAALAVGKLALAGRWQWDALPHPSSQGLLMDAPNRGRGMRLADLQAYWQERLVSILGGIA